MAVLGRWRHQRPDRLARPRQVAFRRTAGAFSQSHLGTLEKRAPPFLPLGRGDLHFAAHLAARGKLIRPPPQTAVKRNRVLSRPVLPGRLHPAERVDQHGTRNRRAEGRAPFCSAVERRGGISCDSVRGGENAALSGQGGDDRQQRHRPAWLLRQRACGPGQSGQLVLPITPELCGAGLSVNLQAMAMRKCVTSPPDTVPRTS
jgi:hypothetical protein